MLSHLRFHRRGGGGAASTAASNPTSPCPDNTPTSPPTSQPSHLHLPLEGPSTLDVRPASSSSSALPPTLPPITRVTSAETEPALESRRDGDMVSRPDPRSQQLPRSPYNGDSGFIGGVALRKYQRDVAALASESKENLGVAGTDNGYATSRPLVPIQEPAPTRPQVLKNSKAITSSFSTPTDLKNATSGPTGRRPAGTRLASDPPALSQTANNPEPPKPKKGLPFLKNPMSTLLMRRKTSQHVPDLLPLPLGKRNEEPMYDPRIRGTRVHDFSAPRTKKALYVPPTTHTAPPPDQGLPLRNTTTANLNASVPDLQQRQRSNASESLYSTSSQPLQPTQSTTSDNTNPVETIAPPTREAPPVPPKDDSPVPTQPVPAQVSRLIDEVETTLPGSMGSIRSGRSRQASLSGTSIKEFPSAVPRHMKSTSSRFSFDMIGAAEQEKLLEDRHRQREAEKKTADTPVQRDSRFDDFDEDFDYDAMMDDDGLEESIPMVGEDDYDDEGVYEEEIPTYEEEIPMVGDDTEQDLDDPDNDQENFSGFVFSRSNPASSLTSPHSTGLLSTPRDADGRVIGFAMSKDTPGLLSPQIHTASLHPDAEVQAAGLGIQGLDISTTLLKQNGAAFQHNQGLPPTDMPRNIKEDDMYFDDGMIGFENEFAEDLAAPPEWDDTPFDESIFDNHDTDQYGRPIPGAFAQAQSQRRATVEEALKRESDITSRLSAHSALSQSTADTSLSVDHQKAHSDDQTDLPQEFSQEQASEASKLPTPSEDTVAAYQAALAAAAHKAAASGKFQRSTSPPIDASPVLDNDVVRESIEQDESFQSDGGYDDYGYENMADFEMDDEDYVAEANASALANDSDGWYGQEFGFYSAPAPQQLSRDSSSSSLDYEYSNGGFFGPKGGLDRSTSGRMISREPNLTPITERSEYSNRNSIMSMGLPGFSSGTPLQSPGLAQLALLGDRGDDMTLSALLRLRSKAWGGSQISLASSREGSPRSERGDLANSPWGPNYFSPMAPPTGHARKNSVLSTFTADSDGGSISGSPTLTNMGFHAYMQAQQPPLPGQNQSSAELKLPATDFGPQLQDLETKLSPISDTINSPSSAMVSPLELNKSPDNGLPPAIPPRQRPPMVGHRHKNSGDSISYTKEEDSGATRWVMERRRTGEYGQVEILEREVVEGGRI